MKMKNIILIIFALITGVVKTWSATEVTTPLNETTTLQNNTIYKVTSNQTITNSQISVASGATATIYIPAGVTLTITGKAGGNGANGRNGTKVNTDNGVDRYNTEYAPGGSGGTAATPAIRVPEGATLIITGEGTLIAKGGNGGAGGNGGNGESGKANAVNDFAGAGGGGGGGGGGAAAAIGGAGGNGGAGANGAKYTEDALIGSSYGVSGDLGNAGSNGIAMGNVYIVGNVHVSTQGGQQSQTNTYYSRNYGLKGNFGTTEKKGSYYYHSGGYGYGGFDGSTPTYSIGGGGNGGRGGNSGKGGDVSKEASETISPIQYDTDYTPGAANNGTLYIQSTAFNAPDLGSSTHAQEVAVSTYAQMPSAIATTFTIDGESTPLRSIFYGTVIEGMELTAEEKEVTRTGYTFNGYNIKGTSTPVYDANGTFVCPITKVACSTDNTQYVSLQAPGNIVLEAVWTANIYTVQFDKQSGSGGTASVNATYDSAMPSATAPSRTGYTFAGYYTSPNGGGTQYYDENMGSVQNWDIDTNPSTLYAHWTANQYTVSFNPKGGSPSPGSITVTYDDTYGTLPTVTRTGYTFEGWFTEETSGTEVTPSITVQITDAQTLYAHWTANQYTVSFNPKGGSPSPNNITVTYDDTYGTLPTVTRAGYTFDGWFTEETSGTEVTSSTTANITDAQTLYAHWTANTYTVTLDPRKGSVDPESISVTYDETYGTIPTPTRYGFTFGGWYTEETGGSEVTSSTPVHITDNQTLYAHWNPITTDYDSYSVIGDPRLRGNYFRSFYDSHVAYELPDGVTAYKGQADGQYLVLTKIEVTDNNKNILPKDVPVILVAEPSYIDAKTEKGPEPTTGVSIKEISLTTSEYYVAYDGITGNMLIGTDVDISVPDDSYLYYILSYGTVTKRLGFYKWPEGNTLSAHKAYVQQSPSSPAKALIFRFENEATGINDDAILDFADDASEPVIYNLNGIRLSKPQKGINIINGKKIWVK